MKSIMNNKTADIERARNGVGVSTTARIYARKYYASWGWTDMSRMRNADLNEILAQDFMQAEPMHKFRLKTGDIAEIRHSQSMYYIGVVSNNTHNIIAIQSGYKTSGLSKERLQDPEWGKGVK